MDGVERTKSKVLAEKHARAIKVQVPEQPSLERRLKFMLSEIEMASEGNRCSVKFAYHGVSGVDAVAVEMLGTYFSVRHVTEADESQWWLVTW